MGIFESDWLALFVRTYEEQRAAERLRRKLDPEKFRVIVPMRDYVHKKRGVKTTHKVPWLSGYVFVASAESADACLPEVGLLVKRDPYIYKMLSNDGSPDGVLLSPEDKMVLATLLDENFNVATVEAVVDGSRVVLAQGAFGGAGSRSSRRTNGSKPQSSNCRCWAKQRAPRSR